MAKPAEIHELIEVGAWKGLKQWRCKLCQFDSLTSADDVTEHILRVHMNPEMVTPSSRPVLLDWRGRPLISVPDDIEVEVVDEGSSQPEPADDIDEWLDSVEVEEDSTEDDNKGRKRK